MTNEELYQTYIKVGIQSHYAAFLVLNPEKLLNASEADYVRWITNTQLDIGEEISNEELTEYLVGKIKQSDWKLFVNLTDSEVRFGGMAIPPSGVVASLDHGLDSVRSVAGQIIYREIPVIENLPEPSENLLIVSESLRKALPDRKDLLSVCNGFPTSN